MLTNIFGSLFFLSIIVFIISVVLVIVTFFKGKKLGKLKYISIFSLSVIVISFFGFGISYNPTPEQQAKIEQRKQEKEKQKLIKQQEKEQREQKKQNERLEQEKELEQERKEKEEQKLIKQQEKEQREQKKQNERLEQEKELEQERKEKEEQKLIQQQKKEQEQNQQQVLEEDIEKIDKVTNEEPQNNTQEQDTQEQKIITATKKVFGEENYINVFYEPEDNFVLIKAKGKDLLSSSMSAKGMLKSIKDTLYEIREIPDLNVDFNIVYTMVNSAGDTSDDIVIKATYKNETRNSINWDEYVLYEDMPKIADEWWAHTAIETALKE